MVPKRYPAVESTVSEGLITRVLPGLRDGSLDFALVADSGEVPRNEFSCEHLLHQPQVLAVRAGHPVLANPTAAALAACEWMLPGPSSSSRVSDYLLGMFERAQVAPPTLVTRGDAMAAIALVRSADIVSVMPLPLLQQPETRGIVAGAAIRAGSARHRSGAYCTGGRTTDPGGGLPGTLPGRRLHGPGVKRIRPAPCPAAEWHALHRARS